MRRVVARVAWRGARRGSTNAGAKVLAARKFHMLPGGMHRGVRVTLMEQELETIGMTMDEFLENTDCAHEALRASVWKGKSGLIERVCQGNFRSTLLERLPWVKGKIEEASAGEGGEDGHVDDDGELRSVDDVVQALVRHINAGSEAEFVEMWNAYREHLDGRVDEVQEAWQARVDSGDLEEGACAKIGGALDVAREKPHAWSAHISDAILHMVSVEDYENLIKENLNDTSTPFSDGVCLGHIASITGQPLKQITRIMHLFQQKPMILFACIKVEFVPTWLEDGDEDGGEDDTPRENPELLFESPIRSSAGTVDLDWKIVGGSLFTPEFKFLVH